MIWGSEKGSLDRVCYHRVCDPRYSEDLETGTRIEILLHEGFPRCSKTFAKCVGYTNPHGSSGGLHLVAGLGYG